MFAINCRQKNPVISPICTLELVATPLSPPDTAEDEPEPAITVKSVRPNADRTTSPLPEFAIIFAP